MNSGTWIAVAVLGAAGAAQACSCRSSVDVQPGDGATNVPRNAVVRLTASMESMDFSTATLRSADGGVVETRLVARTPTTVELRPRALLEPNAVYAVSGGMPGFAGSAFTTGSDEDHEAPSAPVLSGGEDRYVPASGNCGDSESLELHFTTGHDGRTPDAELAYEVATGPSETSVGAEPSTLLVAQNTVLQEGLCTLSLRLKGVGSLAAQLRAVDWAGNVSAPSVAKQVKGLGCAATPASALPALALVGLAALGRRRAPTQRRA
jgi:uncharacterized protein (TIGR03382 family)